MEISVKKLAEIVGGDVRGNGDTILVGLAGVEEAFEGCVVLAENKDYFDKGAASAAACVIAPENIVSECGKDVIAVKDIAKASAAALACFDRPSRDPKKGVHPAAVVEDSAVLGENVSLGAGCYIGEDAVIGKDCVIYPGVYVGPRSVVGDGCTLYANAVLYGDLKLGRGVILHSGAVIGADGFGYLPSADGPVKLPHIGTVEIGDFAEIGANSTVDRGKMGATVIGHHTKIDNLVHIAHNCKVGNYCLIVAQTGVAGTSVLEDGVTLAAQVGVANHVRVGAGAIMVARSATVSDIPAKAVVSGYPNHPLREEQRIQALKARLPQLNERVRALEKELAALKKESSEE